MSSDAPPTLDHTLDDARCVADALDLLYGSYGSGTVPSLDDATGALARLVAERDALRAAVARWQRAQEILEALPVGSLARWQTATSELENATAALRALDVGATGGPGDGAR